MQMINKILPFAFTVLCTWTLQAQKTEYAKDIAPIIYKHCSHCHRPGEIGPIPLGNYEEVKAWANMIEYVTATRYMPPWKPNPEYSNFLGENYLNDEQIEKISKWVADGTPYGNAADEPAYPIYTDGSQIGIPDLVLSFSEAFEHQGNNKDEYRVFVLPTNLSEDKEIASIELRPGNRNIVHHALFTYDDKGEAKALDDATPEYGYDGFGGFGINGVFDKQFPGYVPGQKARLFPDGLAQKLPAGSDLLVQMHYAPVFNSQKDSSSVNIFYAKTPAERFVQNFILLPISPYIQNGPFIMPPDQVKNFHCSFPIPAKVSLFGISPHMHLLGQDWKVYATKPSGEVINLIEIIDWDFNWQGTYYFKKFVVLDPGTIIHAYATYDNTSENPINPNMPPKFVSWGEKTTDEMFYLPFSFVEYQQGDEFVVFEDNEVVSDKQVPFKYRENKILSIYPNPAVDEIIVGYSLVETDEISAFIIDLEGKIVKTLFKDKLQSLGFQKEIFNVSDLVAGTYHLLITGNQFRVSKMIIKQ